jgi:hypothetical protein
VLRALGTAQRWLPAGWATAWRAPAALRAQIGHPSASTFPVRTGLSNHAKRQHASRQIGGASRQQLAFSADGLKMSHPRIYARLPHAALTGGPGCVAVDQPLIGGSAWRLLRLARSRALAGEFQDD